MFRENTYVIQPTIPGSRIGTDAAGVIEAVGTGVNGLEVGDRVIAGLGFDVSRYGTHGETAILPARYAHKYPGSLSASEAASISVPYVTAWGALIDQGEMAAGDHVLVTAASSSVGVAAIQLAKAVGAVPIAVTRSAGKRQGLLDVGAAEVIVTDEEDLGERVKEITEGNGVRLIFDAVAGSTLESIGDIAADGAIVFLYGAFELGATPVPLLPTIMKEVRLWGYVVYSVHNSPERLQRGLGFIFRAIEEGRIKPIIDKTFPLSQYAEAHRYLESNQQIGRVVVTV
jgi:NADPH:quinone reductase-like Zn-dependent oxidoreductase